MQSSIHRILLLLPLCFLTTSVFGQTGLTPIAGTGGAGFSGDGGPATSAALNGPTDVALDHQGNLYIADRNNNSIRKVGPNGVITTTVGTGGAAILNHPFAATTDSGGNLYVGDFDGSASTSSYSTDTRNPTNSRIHRVNAGSGTIDPIKVTVSGLFASVPINGFLAFAINPATNNLYFSERLGNRIFEIVTQTGAIIPIAGTGTAGFSGDGGAATKAKLNNPAHLAFDPAGNLYVADAGNNRVRKITPGTNIITTVAGTGAAGFGGDNGPALRGQLNDPEGVAVDSAGDLFIADTGNRRIREVSAKSGLITSVVEPQTNDQCGGSAALQTPVSVISNPAGDTLYIADDSGNRVWKTGVRGNPPAPTLASITPATGAPGTQVTVTLTGSGFAGNATPGCQTSATTVSVGGSGITVGGVSVGSDTSLTANFTIAATGALGVHQVTVETDGGNSSPASFTVSVPVAPAPTLSSINPPSGVRGTSVTATLTGTNFDIHAGNTSVTADGAGITISQVSVASATSLTAVLGIGASATLGNHNLKVTTGSGSSGPVVFSVLPGGLAFVYNLPQVLNPTDQAPIQVALTSATPDSVTGTLTVTFTPNATNPSDDPNVTIVNADASSRNSNVTFPANALNANLAMSNGVLQAGTVAGTIELSMTNVQDGGVGVTAANGTFDVQVPQLPPVITNIRVLNRSASGFNVEITGYSTTRDITAATFDFGAATGQKLLTVSLQPDVNSPFTTYYQSPDSGAVGSAFVYTQPFTIKQGTVNAVASVSVTLANSAGSSQPASAPVQ